MTTIREYFLIIALLLAAIATVGLSYGSRLTRLTQETVAKIQRVR